MVRRVATMTSVMLAVVLFAGPAAQACGFLVSANGAVQLDRTTTFVAWEDGVEHYITNFSFRGPAESFGSLIPLPAEPTDVQRAGDWTLQRLGLEVNPAALGTTALRAVAAESADDARVVLQTRIDSLDVVVLEGGGPAVLRWVNENGFDLPPGPETDHMLDFYASRSPYFMAARFDAAAAAEDGFAAGDGIPVQITIPTERPWVPLHILHGASPDTAIIEADVYLLTPERPALLHGEGLTVERSERASTALLDDLRSDENMDWVPRDGWFTYLRLDTEAANVVYDLSVGVDGAPPSYVDAAMTPSGPLAAPHGSGGTRWQRPMLAGGVLLLAGGLALRRHRTRR